MSNTTLTATKPTWKRTKPFGGSHIRYVLYYGEKPLYNHENAPMTKRAIGWVDRFHDLHRRGKFRFDATIAKDPDAMPTTGAGIESDSTLKWAKWTVVDEAVRRGYITREQGEELGL